MSIRESLRSMLLCEHPLTRRAQVVGIDVSMQWCADCGAMRWLAGSPDPPWMLCAGMDAVRSGLLKSALDKTGDDPG